MTQMIEQVGLSAADSVDFVKNEFGVDQLWVPEGAGTLATDMGEFGNALVKMDGLSRDPARGFLKAPVGSNVDALRGQAGQLVALETADSDGNTGLFPAIILEAGKNPTELRFGVLNTAPYKDTGSNIQPGDRLTAGGAPTQQQAFALHLMATKEARGAGEHGARGEASSADVVHGGVSLGVVTQPQWAQNPHGKVHELAGEGANPGTGTSAGFSQAGLTSITGFSSEKVVVNPSHVYWNPAFASVRRPEDLLRAYSSTELVMAVGVAALGSRGIPRRNLKSEIAAGAKAIRQNMAVRL
jgi:hypothetical protein